MNLSSDKKLLINLGCGLNSPRNWLNCDSSLHAQLAKHPFVHSIVKRFDLLNKSSQWSANVEYINLNRPLPWATDTVDVVYSSHVLEHLKKSSAVLLLKESLRVLKPGGTLRIVVPDMFYHAKKYADNAEQGQAALADFLYTINLCYPEDRNIIKRVYNHLMGFPSVHKTMYDHEKLKGLLEGTGFAGIAKQGYGISSYISNISEIEGTSGYEGSLYLEAKKPS